MKNGKQIESHGQHSLDGRRIQRSCKSSILWFFLCWTFLKAHSSNLSQLKWKISHYQIQQKRICAKINWFDGTAGAWQLYGCHQLNQNPNFPPFVISHQDHLFLSIHSAFFSRSRFHSIPYTDQFPIADSLPFVVVSMGFDVFLHRFKSLPKNQALEKYR